MIKRIRVALNERVVVFRNGLPVRVLGPGKHTIWGSGITTQRFALDELVFDAPAEVRAILPVGWFDEVELSHRGKVWSYTNAEYPPPPPFVAADPYEPFAIAAVELEREKIVVLGQLADGLTVDDVSIGTDVELVLETLFEDDDNEYVVWKWRAVDGGDS